MMSVLRQQAQWKGLSVASRPLGAPRVPLNLLANPLNQGGKEGLGGIRMCEKMGGICRGVKICEEVLEEV